MKSQNDRMKEFVRYHIHGDGECNNVVLKEWAKAHCQTKQEKYELAYLFSITYCVESAIVLFLNKDKAFTDAEWAKTIKPKIIFQSDRKYVRMKDSFERVLRQFSRISSVETFLEDVTQDGIIKLAKAIPKVSKWEMFGRFSAFLFLETFAELTGIPVDNTTIEWKNGDTATSGLLNLFGLDTEANLFDKTGQLITPPEQMDKMLIYTLQNIKKAGGETNVTEVETSLCAYRKFYKGSRYNGYYLDRMLEEIYKMQADFPAISAELIGIRKQKFDARYLGEIGGWSGIRKEMKKRYIKTGEVL